MTAQPWPGPASAPTVTVLLDTAGFLRTVPLTGAAARTARLNEWMHQQGAETTVLLCDLNPESRPSGAWPLPVRYLPYASVYEHPERLRLHLAELAPDVLVMSTTQLAVRYGRELADSIGAALIYEMHDDEASLLHALGDAGHATAAVLQTAAVQAADGVIAFTDRDAATARALGAAAVHVVPCGVDPGPVPRPRPSSQSRVVFVGNGYYEPNRRAVQWLHDVLAPSLPADTVIEVIGRYPTSLRGLADRLRLRGPVRDLRSALESATVAVAPLEVGGGMKLKVLDYCAAGLPVVGTAEAFVGFGETEQWAVDAELAELPGQVAALLNDEVRRRRLGTRGRRLVEQHYSWAAHARTARAAYSAIVEQHRGGPRGSSPDAEARAVAAELPYWLREWRSRPASTPTSGERGRDMDDDTTGEGQLAELAEDLDCARVAAAAAVGTPFVAHALVGYGGRSVVYLAEQAVLKVYTHRPEERCAREAAGLRAAAHAVDLRVPEVLACEEQSGPVAWLAATRLSGTQPAPQEATTTLGHVAARLHTLPAEHLAEMPEHRRRLRELPAGTSPAHQAASQLEAALAEADPAAEANSCTRERGFVHGDFSSRNILLAAGEHPGIIDVEGSGVGCCYDDLGALVLHESLLGTRDRRVLLAVYDAERRRLHPTSAVVRPEHLAYHLVLRARWIMQWALELDPELAEQVTTLTPWLLTALHGTEEVL